MRIAILSTNLSAVEVYPAARDDVRAVYPNLTLGSVMNDDSLIDWPRLVLVRDTAPPAADFGETVSEQTPTFSNGAWRQNWSKQSITLAQAKTQLADLVVTLYWTKMQAVPDRQELQAAGRVYSAVIAAREARFGPKLDDVAARIQAAPDIAAAYVIYRELADAV